MFEKEAEEIAKDIYIHHFDDDVKYPEVLKAITVGVQKGAEFGYNKANEWHYVKDGDLPKRENLECLCIIRPMKEKDEPFENKDFRGVLYYRNERFYLDENDSNDLLKETNSDFTELVIAWKEIVLPELKENK